MTQKNDTKLGKVEDDPLWREVNELAEFMYDRVKDFGFDEKWDIARRLKSESCDLLNMIGMAAGNANPIGAEYDWGTARKYASGLKTMYRFAGRQKYIELDPAIMVRLDKLITQIDERLAKAEQHSEAKRKQNDREQQQDLEVWREKHRLWKEMNV